MLMDIVPKNVKNMHVNKLNTSLYLCTMMVYYSLQIFVRVKKVKVSRNRPRWPKGFRVG
jgi:hypothetical protein